MSSDNSYKGPLECEDEHDEEASSTNSDEDVDLLEEVEFPIEEDVDVVGL